MPQQSRTHSAESLDCPKTAARRHSCFCHERLQRYKDAEAQAVKGNKAAGTRARKASLEIEKVMKEFRKVSLEASKK